MPEIPDNRKFKKAAVRMNGCLFVSRSNLGTGHSSPESENTADARAYVEDSAGRGEPPRVFWGAGSTLAAECSASAV